jgi:GAF domain-containing protein
MGQRLLELYTQADALGGFPAKVRLAGLLGITSTQAGSVPDTPEVIDKCASALKTLKEELRVSPTPSSGRLVAPAHAPLPAAAGKDAELRLRRFNQVIADVLGQRSVFFARPKESFARLTEAAADGLQCGRASIWFYDDRRTLIRCADLFERSAAKHSTGIELQASAFPKYFAALQTQRTIAAHDAHTDARTAEFAKPYLAPLGIGAMLDVPVWVDGQMVGVVCNEHMGNRRDWTSDDENFAYAMAGFVALAEERRRRGT